MRPVLGTRVKTAWAIRVHDRSLESPGGFDHFLDPKNWIWHEAVFLLLAQECPYLLLKLAHINCHVRLHWLSPP
jgi:hypothetical protein